MTVGASHARIDGHTKVTGEAQYPSDLIGADALVAKLVFTNQPHARLLSLDISAAEATPGVIAVLGSGDVPVNEYGLTLFDQPVFIGLDHTGRSEIPCDVSRWEADNLVLIVAETAEAANAAAAAIEAEWELLPLLADIDAALADDAPLLHHENGLDTNAYTHYRIRKGDPVAAMTDAAVVIEQTYEFPYQEHAYLQPEAALAHLDDHGRVTIHIAGQWTHEDQEQIAHALDLPIDRVRVIYPAIGGAFGGREDMSLQIVLALAAWHLAGQGEHRPIGCVWSREESILAHHKRHRGRARARLGADAEGRIVAVEADAWLDAGGYNYTTNKVLGNLHLGLAGCYEVPNARIDSYGVYTNAAIGGAFRGFGGPQAAFVAESQMNRLAEALGLDPIEVRRRNMLREGSIGITQTPMPAGVTLPEIIDEVTRRRAEPLPDLPLPQPIASLPAAPEAVRKGQGVACAFKNIGFSFGFPERCEAEIRLHLDDSAHGDEIGRVELFHAAAEVGQGTHQALLQMTADAVGVPFEQVEGHFSDTSTAGDSGSVSASRMTWMAGNSILGAAEEAHKQWLDGERPAIGHFRFVPPPTEPLDPETGVCVPNFAYGYVGQVADVSIDTETGHIVVDRVISVHDVGRAINPELVRGQVEGGVVQAHGYVLSEDLVVRAGRITNPRLSTYLIPGIADGPRLIEPVILELADPLGPWGARGMAEMPMMTYAPAIIAAVHDATGVWFDTFPLTPSRVLAGLAAAPSTVVELADHPRESVDRAHTEIRPRS